MNFYEATDDIEELSELVDRLSDTYTVVAEYCHKWKLPEPIWLDDVGDMAREAEEHLELWEEQIRAEDEHEDEYTHGDALYDAGLT